MYELYIYTKGDPLDYLYQGIGLTLKEVLEKTELALREYGEDMEVLIRNQ